MRLFEKAAERGVNIIPPLDFIVSPQFDISKTGQAAIVPGSESQRMEQEGEKTGGSRGAKEEAKRQTAAASEKDGPKAEGEIPKTAEEKPPTGWDKEIAILNEHPEMHWTDVVY